MADNDGKYIKAMKECVKWVIFKISFAQKKILKGELGNELLFSAIKEGGPFAAIRFGAVEARCVSAWIKGKSYSSYDYVSIKDAAGFFPNDKASIDSFCRIYTNSARLADVVAVWGVKDETKLINMFCKKATLVGILSLEPYFYEKPWSAALKGKKILVVHPFVDTIQKQINNNKKHIFQNSQILDGFENVQYVKAVQSNAGEKTSFKTWFDALQYMEQQIDEKDYDVAIIGAGAYGLPLAIHCKQKGKVAIQMAGATQILFGIRGKRWENRKMYSNLMNKYWVRAAADETPKGKDKVEGGSYW